MSLQRGCSEEERIWIDLAGIFFKWKLHFFLHFDIIVSSFVSPLNLFLPLNPSMYSSLFLNIYLFIMYPEYIQDIMYT